MAYVLKFDGDKIVLEFGDDLNFDLNTYENFTRFRIQDQSNLTNLKADICSGAAAALEEELPLMNIGTFDAHIKTMAYVRLMQQVTHFVYQWGVEEEEKQRQAYIPPGPGEDF
jgi:hypothetical protein